MLRSTIEVLIKNTLKLNNLDYKDTVEKLENYEKLLADPEIQAFLDLPENQSRKSKLNTAYEKCVKQMAHDILELDRFIAKDLDQLDNTKIGDAAPVSHKNIATAFDNLAKYVSRDIVAGGTVEMRTLIIKRYIAILNYLEKHHDFHGAAAVNSGLCVSAVTQLKTSFVQLTKEEEKILHDANELFIVDQGWGEMQNRLNNGKEIIPNFAGIKKQSTRVKEAKGAHELHKDHLVKSGKIESTSTISGSRIGSRIKNQETSVNPNKKFEDAILKLQKSSKRHFFDLTSIKSQIAPNYGNSQSVLSTFSLDADLEYKKSAALEKASLPLQIQRMQNKLIEMLNKLNLEKIATPKSEVDLTKTAVILTINEKCHPHSDSVISISEQRKLIKKILAENDKLQKHDSKIVGLVNDFRGEETPIINQLKKIKKHIKRLEILVNKQERLLREELPQGKKAGSIIAIPHPPTSLSPRSPKGSYLNVSPRSGAYIARPETKMIDVTTKSRSHIVISQTGNSSSQVAIPLLNIENLVPLSDQPSPSRSENAPKEAPKIPTPRDLRRTKSVRTAGSAISSPTSFKSGTKLKRIHSEKKFSPTMFAKNANNENNAPIAKSEKSNQL